MSDEREHGVLSLALLIALQAAVSGASLVVEIVAGRMIAPYVGMSLYTWTAIIAVVLAGFSAGHWWGGRIAARPLDRALRFTGLAMAGAAVACATATLLLRIVAGPVLAAIDAPLAAIVALAALVFFLPSLLAGVPAPVLAVAAMRGRARPEPALGAIFAAGALGAILGTLLAGFLFIAWLGSAATMLAMAATYAAAALILLALARSAPLRALLVLLPLLAFAVLATSRLSPVCDVESRYYCIRTVALSDDPERRVRLMVIDHLAHGIGAESAPRVMFTEHTALLDALPRMRMAGRDFTSFHIGGGSYSVPRAWADRGLGGITVAEIDPAVTDAAIRDFWFDPAAARILHLDGRAALREDDATYDVILGDAFTDIAVPPHLVTREFFALVRRRLRPGGVFAMNLADNVDRLDALAALVVTLEAVFPSVEVWTEARPPRPGERRIFVLLAGDAPSPVSEIVARSPEPTGFAALDPQFVADLVRRKRAMPLTDDHAPIDRLIGLDPLTDAAPGGL